MDTLNFVCKTTEQVLTDARANGHYWTVVKPSDFDPNKWTLRKVELTDSKLIPKAREEGEQILKSGVYVERFVLAEEIDEKPAQVPWRSIGMVAGAMGLTLVAVSVGLGVLALIVGALALIVKAIVTLVPVIFVGVMVMGLLMIDPVLIAVVHDGAEEKWVKVSFWVH